MYIESQIIRKDRVVNGNFIIYFSDRNLNDIFQDDIFAYDFQLGPNKLTLSIKEYDEIKTLSILDKYFNRYIDITIYVSKQLIEKKKNDNYYSIMFKRCKLNKIFNESTCGEREESTIDIQWIGEEYEIRY